jgi:hypothetical protein
MKESDILELFKALEDELERYGASEKLRIAILETVNNWYPGVMFNNAKPNNTVPDDEVDTEW